MPNTLSDALDGIFVKPEATALDTCVLGSETWEGGGCGNKWRHQAVTYASGGRLGGWLVAGPVGRVLSIVDLVIPWFVVVGKEEVIVPSHSHCGVYVVL